MSLYLKCNAAKCCKNVYLDAASLISHWFSCLDDVNKLGKEVEKKMSCTFEK